MKTLNDYRASQDNWSDFDYREEVDNTEANCRRYRILLEIQYDWQEQEQEQEQDHELVRYLFEEEIKTEEEFSTSIFESYDLASFLLLKFKDPTDIPLFVRAKHASFDKGCGYDREHFFVTLREKTEDYLEKNFPKSYGAVAGDYEEYEFEENLEDWWQYRLYCYPSSRDEVDIYNHLQNSILFQDRKQAEELLAQWDAETEDSEEKRNLLHRIYSDLGEYKKLFELSKKIKTDEEKSLQDRASDLKDFVVLATKAEAYPEALEYAKALALVFTQTTEWYDIGLGRMAKEEVFNLAKSSNDKEIAKEAFYIAHKWHEENCDMSWSGLESAWKSAEYCGLEEKRIYYKELADIERRRIDEM